MLKLSLVASTAIISTVLLTSSASASILTFALTNSSHQAIDTFTLNSAGGLNDAAGTPPYVYFNLLSDTAGYNAAYFGDSGASFGQLGIGYGSGNLVSQYITENFTPAFYNDTGVNVPFMNGSYTASSGDILTISGVTSAPEASTWVMMLAGFVGLGFAGYRKARPSAATGA